MLIGGDNGRLYQAGNTTDDGQSIAWVWATAPTAHGLPGVFSVHDLMIAHQSTQDLQLIVAYDGVAMQYTVPASGGFYVRAYSLLAALKGYQVVYGLSSGAPFRVFRDETLARVQAWGEANGYISVQPLGGVRRRDGAVV